jgi:hypothetical protein
VLPSPTTTPTVPWDNTFTIDDIKTYPNPYKQGTGDLSVSITISKPASELKVRLYTVNFRRIFETPAVSADTRGVTITVPGWKLAHLAAGTYYMVVSGISTDKERALSKPLVLIILK